MRVVCPIVAGIAVTIALTSGCMSPDAQAVRTQNVSLVEQNRALAAKIENVEVHARNVEKQLADAEQQLALNVEQREQADEQLQSFRRSRQEREQLGRECRELIGGRVGPTRETVERLEQLSRKHTQLRFDPQTGLCKFDTDILFDEGSAALKPEAEQMLRHLVEILRAPDADELRVVAAGHTAERQFVAKGSPDKSAEEFALATQRALAVATFLREAGLSEERIAVASFAGHQPIVASVTEEDRRKNRRVELFLLAPQAPVVGWTETIPTVY
jgi:chemotaxis protein MotB